MKIEFSKMQGCGNDYIYINCIDKEIDNPEKLSIKMSQRHFEVGSDGIVLICKSNVADAKMRMFNIDGSEGKMCGNAIRCIGKYLYDNKITDKKEISIETLSGIKYLTLFTNDKNKVEKVKVDMGYASFKPSDIDLTTDCEIINEKHNINNKDYNITCVSMGNPHMVIYEEGIKNLELDKIGPVFENYKIFKNKVNTEFVEVISPNELNMRVYERGSGETYACGTGACAVVSASVKNGVCKPNTNVLVHLIGGTLEIMVDSNYKVFMTGPARLVYTGVYEYDED
ncbi:MAG: diaminopimelate epimerase [Acholeplasmatales bacterium]|nr:diaminopimelate epimerase [Acholeplasmatales bacterium]